MRKAFFVLVVLPMVMIPGQVMAAGNDVLGAVIGAGAGAVIGHQVNRRGGAGQGAVIGALGGYFLGKQMGKGAKAAPPPAPVQAAPRTFDDCATAATDYDRANRVRDIQEKVFLLQNSTRQCTGNALYHNDLGVAYYQRNSAYDRQRARHEFAQALRIDPNYQSAKQNLRNL
ncbi:MAG: glycine zipper 2TM domain-containing protein [Mariprofundales bacterium]